MSNAYIAICAICRDEDYFIDEWIRYHRHIGVGKFFIYDDRSIVPLESWLIADDVVITTPKGGISQQSAYVDFFEKYKHLAEWVAIIDLDEVIVPIDGMQLAPILNRYEKFGGIVLNTKCFGSSGYINRPAGGQIQNYVMAHNKMSGFGKSIVRTCAVGSYRCWPMWPHVWKFNNPYYAVTEDFMRCDGYNQSGKASIIRLNHYYTRSREDWIQKCNRGFACGPISVRSERGLDIDRREIVEFERNAMGFNMHNDMRAYDILQTLK